MERENDCKFCCCNVVNMMEEVTVKERYTTFSSYNNEYRKKLLYMYGWEL